MQRLMLLWIIMERVCSGQRSKGGVFYPANKNGKVKKNDLIVIRSNRAGVLSNSRPCFNCLNMMKAVNIRKVFYTDNEGNVVSEIVKDMLSIQASAVTKYIHMINTDSKFTWESYFENLLKKLFPSSIKKINFDNFIRHNLVNVLPGHTYIIERKDGADIVSIFSSKKSKLVSCKII